jgi:tRNA pseudouridine38-40 synthase
VHAVGQVIAFELEWAHSVDELARALNALLPRDLAARDVQVVEAGFHPRFDARERSYLYRIYIDALRRPLEDPFAWRVWPEPNLEAMQRSAGALLGSHNFAAFGSPVKVGGSTVRTIFRAGWQAGSGELRFTITADAFLYRMVRRLVYAQVMVGQGRLEEAEFAACLDISGDCPGPRMQGLAPACGLTLVHVGYP